MPLGWKIAYMQLPPASATIMFIIHLCNYIYFLGVGAHSQSMRYQIVSVSQTFLGQSVMGSYAGAGSVHMAVCDGFIWWSVMGFYCGLWSVQNAVCSRFIGRSVMGS